VKAAMRYLCLLLLLPACMPDPADQYDYTLAWSCRSPAGCERTEEVKLIDRLNVTGDSFRFESSRAWKFNQPAQRVASDSLPPGCALLRALSLFGHELEPSKICEVADGFDLELSIPNADLATSSVWLVQARWLGGRP
jgi:hypothetical protein